MLPALLHCEALTLVSVLLQGQRPNGKTLADTAPDPLDQLLPPVKGVLSEALSRVAKGLQGVHYAPADESVVVTADASWGILVSGHYRPAQASASSVTISICPSPDQHQSHAHASGVQAHAQGHGGHFITTASGKERRRVASDTACQPAQLPEDQRDSHVASVPAPDSPDSRIDNHLVAENRLGEGAGDPVSAERTSEQHQQPADVSGSLTSEQTGSFSRSSIPSPHCHHLQVPQDQPAAESDPLQAPSDPLHAADQELSPAHGLTEQQGSAQSARSVSAEAGDDVHSLRKRRHHGAVPVHHGPGTSEQDSTATSQPSYETELHVQGCANPSSLNSSAKSAYKETACLTRASAAQQPHCLAMLSLYAPVLAIVLHHIGARHA